MTMIGDQREFAFMASELASELYCDEVLDGSGCFQYLDSVRSVSAFEGEGEDVHPCEDRTKNTESEGFSTSAGN